MIATLLASVTLVFAHCPAEMGQVGGCYDPATDVVTIIPGFNHQTTRTIKAHELGHAYDDQHLDDSERGVIIGLMKWHQWRPERFAQEFAACYVPNKTRDIARGWFIWTPERPASWLCSRLPDFL